MIKFIELVVCVCVW